MQTKDTKCCSSKNCCCNNKDCPVVIQGLLFTYQACIHLYIGMMYNHTIWFPPEKHKFSFTSRSVSSPCCIRLLLASVTSDLLFRDLNLQPNINFFGCFLTINILTSVVFLLQFTTSLQVNQMQNQKSDTVHRNESKKSVNILSGIQEMP